jgi:hypothetical protein
MTASKSPIAGTAAAALMAIDGPALEPIPGSAYPIRSADHHAAPSEGISCGIGARAPAAGVGEGSPFEPPHVDPSPTPAAGCVVC